MSGAVPEVEHLDVLVARTEGPQPARRLLHAASGVAVWGVLRFSGIESSTAVVLLSAAFTLALAADCVRLRFPAANRLFFRVFARLASPRERSAVASSTWYAAGILLALVAFPRPHAEAGVLVLALADPTASWFGRRYGRRRFGSGSVLGSTLFFVVAALILWPVAGVPAALGAATLVTLVEALPWRVDDNLAVPAATGAALWLLAGTLS